MYCSKRVKGETSFCMWSCEVVPGALLKLLPLLLQVTSKQPLKELLWSQANLTRTHLAFLFDQTEEETHPKSVTPLILQILLNCKVAFVRTGEMEVKEGRGIFKKSKIPFTTLGIEAQENCGKPAWRKEKRGRQMWPFRPTAVRAVLNTAELWASCEQL